MEPAASVPLTSPLRHFTPDEFGPHADLMNDAFCVWLDAVRDDYGWPLTITSAARTASENAATSGSAASSRHLRGEAVDVRFPETANHLWYLVQAVMRVPAERPIELELVHGPADAHVHIAWLAEGRASSLEVAAD